MISTKSILINELDQDLSETKDLNKTKKSTQLYNKRNNNKITPRIQNLYAAALVFHATDRLTCEFQ